MGEKDIAEKILESYNDVFADLVNGSLFDGRQLSDDELKRPYPVMTLVVYLGYKSRWNRPLSLRGCLMVPDEIDAFVHDYGMNLYQVAWMSREEIDRRFHGDFWIVADYFWQKRVYQDYRPSKKRFRHVRETLELLRIMEKDDRYETECQDMIENPDCKEGWNMCDVLDRVENRGLARGLEQGLEQGRAEGAQGMRREGFTLEQIARVYRTDVQTVVGMLRESN